MSRMPVALTLAGSLLLATTALAAPTNHVDDVLVVEHKDRVDVILKTRAAPTFQSFAKRSPAVVILDVLDASAVTKTLQTQKGGVIDEISLAPKTGNGSDVGRLTVRFTSAVFYDVTATENEVTLSVFGTGVTKQASAGVDAAAVTTKTGGVRLASHTPKGFATDSPQPRFAQANEEGGAGMSTGEGGQRAMTYVGFRNLATQSEVFARLNGQASYEVKREGENLLVLEVKNAVVPLDNNKNHLDATFFDSPVKMVTPTEVEDATPTIRIIIEMKEDVPYRTEMRGRELTVIFQKSAG